MIRIPAAQIATIRPTSQPPVKPAKTLTLAGATVSAQAYVGVRGDGPGRHLPYTAIIGVKTDGAGGVAPKKVQVKEMWLYKDGVETPVTQSSRPTKMGDETTGGTRAVNYGMPLGAVDSKKNYFIFADVAVTARVGGKLKTEHGFIATDSAPPLTAP